MVELIKSSATPLEAREKLMTAFSLSEVQAQSILDMRLQRLTGLEVDKIEEPSTPRSWRSSSGWRPSWRPTRC